METYVETDVETARPPARPPARPTAWAGPIWAHMGPYGAHMGPYTRKIPKNPRKFLGIPRDLCGDLCGDLCLVVGPRKDLGKAEHPQKGRGQAVLAKMTPKSYQSSHIYLEIPRNS